MCGWADREGGACHLRATSSSSDEESLGILGGGQDASKTSTPEQDQDQWEGSPGRAQ